MSIRAMKDSALLIQLVDSGKLVESELQAFSSMLGTLEHSPNIRLTSKQRSWVESVYTKLHLSDPNVQAQLKEERSVVSATIQKGKVMKPFGKKCPEGTGACKMCPVCKL